ELHNRQRRRTYVRIAASVLLAIAAGGVGLGFWDAQYRSHYAYYKDYVRRWGAWEGVDPIDKATFLAREKSYEFIHRGRYGPVIAVRLVNSAGHCAVGNGIPSVLGIPLTRDCSEARACSAHFKYEERNVKEEELRD